METNTFKDLLPEDLRNCEASPAVWAYIADLLAKVSELKNESSDQHNIIQYLETKVSEQQKEIERLQEANNKLNNFSVSKAFSEQSQRIQQLEGLLKRTLEYDFEIRHPDHPVYKLIAEIKAALNL